MSVERNTLMEKVYPRLKDYCRERHGLEFQVNSIQNAILECTKTLTW